MPYKEINIKIRIVNGRVGTIINQNFPEDIESVHAFIGMLENIKAQQLEKLNNKEPQFKRENNPDHE